MEVRGSFAFAFVYFSVPGVFFRNRWKELVPPFNSCLDYGKEWKNFMRAFWKYFEANF